MKTIKLPPSQLSKRRWRKKMLLWQGEQLKRVYTGQGETMTQTNFLHLIPVTGTIEVRVTVSEAEPGKWLATIAGGWWVAYGKDRKSAIKRVIRNFEKDI